MQVKISNSIFKANIAADGKQVGIAGAPANSAAERYVIYSIVDGGYTGNGNLNLDPMFLHPDNPEGNDGIFGTADDGLRIASNSPAVDLGRSWLNINQSDLLGYPRLSNKDIDAGAYEYQRINTDYAQLLDELKSGGLIIVFRHGITDHSQVDSAGFSNDLHNCLRQRNLNQEGIDQSIFIGRCFSALELPVDSAFASPMCRTRHTADYIFSNYEESRVWLGVDPNYTLSKREELGKIPSAGFNTGIVTHQNSIELVTDFLQGEVLEGDAVVIRPLGNNNYERVAHITTDTWERMILLLDITTDIKNENILPSNYVLEQNYPNPFNPATTISYQLPESGLVTLNIYDALGSEITKLVNEYKNSGRYEVLFNASGYASGVYFYSLRAGDFITTKKFILMK